jgi:hypothetical protein
MNRNLISLITIIIVVLLSNPVKGQTNQDFDALLSAYQKARIQYGLAETMNQPSETIYWMEQYSFYQQNLDEIISKYDQAARENPRTYCLSALNLYDKYIKATETSPAPRGILPSLFIGSNSFNQLQTYCGRFDIYYKPNQRM